MDIAFWSASKLIRALKAKKVGALELLEHYAGRIATHDKALNALPVLDMDVARKRAKAYDRKGAKVGPLAGLPMTVKESFDLRGFATTAMPSRCSVSSMRAATCSVNRTCPPCSPTGRR